MNTLKRTLVIFLSGIFGFSQLATAQTGTISAGSFIINMGVVPQTIANGLQPYGLIYDLLSNYQVPIYWSINASKVKDGADFTYNGTVFSGGPFIIDVKYRNSVVNARIAYWQSLGVVGVTTTSSITVPLVDTLFIVPRWTLDHQNGSIAVTFFENAGIPSSAYGGSSSTNWPYPSQLTCCDDIFVMPHADPTWATHSNLYTWNLTCKGAIWLGCHAGSALTDMFDNVTPNYNMQTNFLAEKTGPASGSGPYYQNSLVLYSNHGNGVLPYSYDYSGDRIMQFMGTIDAATQNGSEQCYIPLSSGWRASTKVGVYDSLQTQQYNYPNSQLKYRVAIIAYGPGMGDTSRGTVLMEASHNIANSNGTANVAAQRIFFNFSIKSIADKAILPVITGLPSQVYSGVPVPLTFILPPGINVGNYTIQWSSSLGGTFTPNSTQQSVSWVPPAEPGPTSCNIEVVITDACGRKTFNSQTTLVSCNLTVTPTITQPTCHGYSNGYIQMNITGGSSITWTWTRVSPSGNGSGSGTLIQNLSAGTYNVTVTAASSGCVTSFSAVVSQPVALSASTVVTPVSCYGGSNGTITLTVTGGTAPYTYSWTDLSGSNQPQNRTGLPVGTYNVNITDVNGCTVSASGIVTGPSAALTVSGVQTNVSCFGGANGTIALSVSGGTSPYTYNWADLSGSNQPQNRTGLSIGTYSVTVTDSRGCTAMLSKTITQPLALSLSVTVTQPTCPTTPFNGAITLTVTGGTSPYTYNWADLSGSNQPQNRTGIGPGTYTVLVTDSNGCTATISATLVATSNTPAAPSTINP